MRKQKKLIAILAVIVCVLVGVYFAVVMPIINREDPPETTEPIETTDGEEIGVADRILMFGQVTREHIERIEVHNEEGEFTFYRTDGGFKIEGHEDVSVDAELFASFITSCGYTLSISRIDEPEPFAEYGLDDTTIRYTLTTTDGDVHTVYIGDETVAGNGYYARYEGRDSVYILDAAIADTVMEPVENMVTPLLSYYEYSFDKKLTYFNFFRDGELYFRLEALSAAEEVDLEAMAAYKMTYPTSYVPKEECSTIFQSLSGLKGTKTVALGVNDEELARFGLDEPKCQITFGVDDLEHYLVISEKTERGTYYVGSGFFDIIAEVDASTMAFVEYDLINWVSPYIFRMNIASIDTLELTASDFHETFSLEGTGDTLTVKTLSNGQNVDVNNFKAFYRDLLIICIEGDPAFSDEEKKSAASDENLYLMLNVKTRTGLEREYKFHRYSDRRSFLEINGSGDFYVLHNIVAKIKGDAEKVVSGQSVDYTEKYD